MLVHILWVSNKRIVESIVVLFTVSLNQSVTDISCYCVERKVKIGGKFLVRAPDATLLINKPHSLASEGALFE